MKLLTTKLNKIVLATVLSAAVLSTTLSVSAFAADVNSDRVEYIWPSVQVTANNNQMQQTLSSDEYWETVTGAQLRKGVQVFASDNALVRLAPKASYRSGSKLTPLSLNLDAVYLQSLGNQSLGNGAQLSQLASQKDMEDAGFYDGSVALKVANASGGPVTIATSQNLAANDTYLVHVKEKGTANQLTVNASRFLQGADATLTLDATVNESNASPFSTRAKLIAPDGTEAPARLQNGKVVFEQPLEIVGASQGFYEVQLTTLVSVDGQRVKRSIKVPFVNLEKTAALESVDMGDNASINLSVNEPGRYNITATLQGVDGNGKVTKLQTVDVAEWAEQDKAIALPFEMDKFASYTNLQVVNIKLMDQTRLMPLEFAETL